MTQIAFITGCSSGIGLSAAVQFAKAGFHVIATMRDPTKSAALLDRAEQEDVQLEVMHLDVTSDDSVQQTMAAVLERHGRVDVLLNNAGAGQLGTLEQVTLLDAQRTMDLNFFGVWRTIAAVLPSMRAAGHGRIINVSTIGGIVGQPFNDAYCAAKFALEGAMESLAPVLRPFGIWVSLVEPGPVNTAFVQNVGGAERLREPNDDAYSHLLGAYVRATQAAYASGTTGQSGDEVAAVLLEVALAEAPHFRYQTSPTVLARAQGKFVDPTGDAQIAAMLELLMRQD